MAREQVSAAVKERPVSMCAPMVRSTQADTKTQTRRVMKPQPRRVDGGVPFSDGPAWACAEPGSVMMRCPYGKRGDRLRVKEAAWMWCERRPNGKTSTGRDKWLYAPLREAGLFYAADHPHRPAIDVVSPDTGNAWGWRLKIGRFLPAWASRITLDVTDVRVERLQDISEADALAEGIEYLPRLEGYGLPDGSHYHGTDPRISYWSLWDAINGQGSVEANPLVWVVSFKRVIDLCRGQS